MSAAGIQVRNGKSFEYALLKEYVDFLRRKGLSVDINEDASFEIAKSFYLEQEFENQRRFDEAAKATIKTITLLEPGLMAQNGDEDVLVASLASDSDGQQGDVRDVIFSRPKAKWEMGFSAKNNHDAVKHSRLSNQLDFGDSWLGISCSQEYWQGIAPIFDKLSKYQKDGLKWCEVPNKSSEIYLPILIAFKKELKRICEFDKSAPSKLIKYLIGKKPFYKIIKEDKYNLVVVKAFNIEGALNKRVNGVGPRYKTPKLNLPTRIVELEPKDGSETTLILIMDEGWEVSFRIHNAETLVIPSLKFDIQLLGNPPILFTQHLFQQ